LLGKTAVRRIKSRSGWDNRKSMEKKRLVDPIGLRITGKRVYRENLNRKGMTARKY